MRMILVRHGQSEANAKRVLQGHMDSPLSNQGRLQANPAFVQKLIQMGLEVELVWRHAANLLNYEIIDMCTAQYIDLLVSCNERILTPPDEWLTYLMPHRTRLFFPPPKLLETPEVLAKAIFDRAYAKRKRKRPNPHQLQLEFFSNLERKSIEKFQAK